MTEEYRTIVGYEGLYEVSNLGNVRSLNYRQTGRSQILKPGMTKYGYMQVWLCKSGKHKRCYVHRLVAEAFLENPQNLPQVNHRNELKTDNRAENLEWCDAKYNLNYGTHNQRMAEANRGKHRSEETKRKMSEAHRGKPNPKVAEAHRGKHRSEETKRKISEANINHPKFSKPVLQISKSGEFLREFPSTHEAERETGIAQSNIWCCCQGKYKSAGGFMWRYRESV